MLNTDPSGIGFKTVCNGLHYRTGKADTELPKQTAHMFFSNFANVITWSDSNISIVMFLPPTLLPRNGALGRRIQ